MTLCLCFVESSYDFIDVDRCNLLRVCLVSTIDFIYNADRILDSNFDRDYWVFCRISLMVFSTTGGRRLRLLLRKIIVQGDWNHDDVEVIKNASCSRLHIVNVINRIAGWFHTSVNYRWKLSSNVLIICWDKFLLTFDVLLMYLYAYDDLSRLFLNSGNI